MTITALGPSDNQAMRRIEVDVFNEAGPLVLRDPGRRFPGVLVQGDTLFSLVRDAEELADSLSGTNRSAAFALAKKLQLLLDDYRRALDAHDIKLPYSY